MENKNIIIIAVAIVAVLAVAGFIFATGMLNPTVDTGVTTDFKTEFMEGAFVGKVKLTNDTEKFMHSYRDKENHITYNISTVDNASALMEIYEIQGVTNPEERTFNGNDWNIYFTQAVPGNGSDAKENETMNIVICESQAKSQGYLIYMIIDGDSKVNTSTMNAFGEPYKVFVEPLLKSITLKKSKNVPKISEQYGLTDDEFAQQIDLVRQYKAGNTSALDGGGEAQ